MGGVVRIAPVWAPAQSLPKVARHDRKALKTNMLSVFSKEKYAPPGLWHAACIEIPSSETPQG
jgi:hypothetical protein